LAQDIKDEKTLTDSIEESINKLAKEVYDNMKAKS